MILNIHGYGSNGHNSKYEWISANVKGRELVSPTNDYDHRTPASILTELSALIEDADPREARIVGTSLGGFFAACLHVMRPEITTILVNPSLMPFVTMRKYDVPNEARLLYFERFKPIFERFASGDRDDRLHVIYGDADEVIAHDSLTLPLLPEGARTYRIEGGDHRMPVVGKFAQILAELLEVD